MKLPFDLHQLACFVAIADELHFGRAAKRMNMTQPPLSRQISQLEDRLGVQLLERHSRGVNLTFAGLTFLQSARGLLASAEHSVAQAREAAFGTLPKIAIGFTPAACYRLLPRLTRQFRALAPQVRMELHELTTLPQLSLLNRQALDIALIRPSVSLEQYERCLVERDRMVLAVPASHALNARPSVSLRDLDRVDYIEHDPVRAKYHHDLTWRALQAQGANPQVVLTATEPQVMLAMVRAGLGCALVASAVSAHAKEQEIAFKPIAQEEALLSETWMVWRKGAKAQAVLDFVSAAALSARAPRVGPC